ncbi:MAG: hypothetical protein ABI652_06470 [Acidobacteriota bacterium]
MSTVSNTTADTASGDLAPLFQQLAKRADLNKDGAVSIAEFSQFLQNVIGASNTGSPAATTAVAKATSSLTPAAFAATLPPCPSGWDPVKWVNPNHTTPKYVVARVLENYPPTPSGLVAALPAVQAAMPGTTQVGKDKLDIPGVGVVDVGVAFSNGGGVSWGWMPVA